MTQKGQNIEMSQGEDKTINFFVYDSAGAALDSLSGFTFLWYVATSPTASTTVLTKDSTAGITTSGSNGVVVTLADTDTEGIDPDTYYHELRAIDGSANEDIIALGGFTLLGSITNV